jgi:cytidine deaminase
VTAGELLERARRVAGRAHAPFSGIRVGAVAEDRDGGLHEGVNVESASYGLTLCAERAALARAVAEGHDRVVRVAVARADGVPIVPCGACRQVLSELGDDAVVVHDGPAGPLERPLHELLPDPFRSP